MFGRNKTQRNRNRVAKKVRELRRGTSLDRAIGELTATIGQVRYPRYSKHGRRHR